MKKETWSSGTREWSKWKLRRILPLSRPAPLSLPADWLSLWLRRAWQEVSTPQLWGLQLLYSRYQTTLGLKSLATTSNSKNGLGSTQVVLDVHPQPRTRIFHVTWLQAAHLHDLGRQFQGKTVSLAYSLGELLKRCPLLYPFYIAIKIIEIGNLHSKKFHYILILCRSTGNESKR